MSFLHKQRKHWPVLVLMVVASLILIPSFDGIVGHSLGDMSSHFWGGWWFGSQVLAGDIPIWANETHMPTGGRFYYIDPIGAVLMLVLRPFGPVLAWNLMILLQQIFTVLAAYVLGFDGEKNRMHGFALAVIVVTSSYLLGSIHTGASEYFGLCR